ncbi:Clr5 domain-containing protein [Xylariales sp. PMI_506]|nr:Clr5 domain-containing protein [Xylariales sp. PMI_506]
MVSKQSEPKWASQDDWKLQQATIKQLYMEQNLPLPQVMDIMKRKHQFYATTRMYKSRFEAWEWRKYQKSTCIPSKFSHQDKQSRRNSSIADDYTDGIPPGLIKLEEDAHELIIFATAGQSTPASSKHKIAKPPRRRHVRNTIPPTSLAMPRLLAAPDELRYSEDCIKATLDYLRSRFKATPWSFSPDDEWRNVPNWHIRAGIAKEQIDQGNTQVGFHLLHVCFQQYQSLLEEGHPKLFHRMLSMAMILSEIGPDLVSSYTAYTVNLCSIILGDGHPVTRIWRAFDAVGIQGMRQHALPILRAFYDVLTGILGPRNKLLECLKLEIARSLFAFGSIGLPTALDMMRAIVRDMSADPGYWTVDCIMWGQLEIGSLFAQAGLLREVAAMLPDMERCYAEYMSEFTDRTRTRFLMLKARVLAGTGQVEKAQVVCQANLAVCIRAFGPDHSQTIRVMGQLEQYYREIGQIDAAEQLGTEEKWNSLCRQEAERLGITI